MSRPGLARAGHTRTEILILGAGPAGIAAARVCGPRALWLDENPAPGGQIWRGGKPLDPLSRRWLSAIPHPPQQARVVDLRPGLALAETPLGPLTVAFDKLILATGARELFLPFPGWTLPGVFGAGGLQALVKSGLSVCGKRIVVAGSGPLLLAVAAFLRRQGGEVAAVLEQTPRARLLQFALRHPAKLPQALLLQRGLRYRPNTWVTRFTGTAVDCSDGAAIPCDYLATGYGLVPNTELPAAFPGVFRAGETGGVGGVDKALVEGEIAGLLATGQDASRLQAAHRRALHFANDLAQAFALRPELRALPQPDTIVCRCEDVRFASLQGRRGWRDAKLQTRCGMGPCQSRVCGPANQFLFGWPLPDTRTPFSAVRIDTLIQQEEVPS